MSDESDIELPAGLATARALEPLEVRQRKEIEALRAQVLERTSEAALLGARMRDIDDVYARRLSEQISSQTSARESQRAELEHARRSIQLLERKNSFLSSEVKTLEARRGRGGAAASSDSTSSVVPSDGFIVKKRRLESSFSSPPASLQGAKCRERLAKLHLKNGSLALPELGVQHLNALMGLETPEHIAKYLLQLTTANEFHSVPVLLYILGYVLDYVNAAIVPSLDETAAEDALDFSVLIDLAQRLVRSVQRLPAYNTLGTIYLDSKTINDLSTLIYCLDILVSLGVPVPTPVIELAAKHSCLAISNRGLQLLENAGLKKSECDLVTDQTHNPEPCIEDLFGSIWEPATIDATVLTPFSPNLCTLSWSNGEIVGVCKRQHLHLSHAQRVLSVRVLATCTSPTPKAFRYVLSILCETTSAELIWYCTRFMWKNSDTAEGSDQSVLVSRMAQVAALPADPIVKKWAKDILKELISPADYDLYREMMRF